MRNATRSIAEFGNHKDNGGVRAIVEIGAGAKLAGRDRTIKYKVSGTAIRGDDAVNPEDYYIDGCMSSNCSVRLPANRHSAVITIYVNNDGLDEGDETVKITLQPGSGYTLNNARKTTTVTIRDDDTRGLMFHRTWPDVKEGGSETHTLRLRSQPTAAVTVKIASDNPDVTVSPSSLTFNPSGNNLWDRNQTVTISAAQDSDAVDDVATLTYTTSGGDYSGAEALSIDRPVSVDDDDTGTTTTPPPPPPPPTTPSASFASASSSAAESTGTRNVTVNLAPAPQSGLTLSYSVSGTATAGSGNDFTIQNSGTVTVGAGATTATIPVAINDDSANEGTETVILTLDDGTGYTLGGTRVHTLTITDNDGGPVQPVASFASASSSAAEDAGTRNVTVNLSAAAPAGGLTLGYSVTGTATAGSGNDFTIQNSGTLSVAAGATTASVPVAINDDSTNESAETVILTLTGGTGYTLGSTRIHTLTINDNDGAPPPTTPTASFASVSSSAAEDAGTRNVTVNLSSAAPSGGLTLGYSVSGTATAGSGNDFTIQNSGTLSIAAGATSASIPIAINDDSANENAETVILTLTGGAGYTLGSTRVHTLTITDNDSAPPPTTPTASFAFGSSSAAENAGTRNVTVNLSSAAPSGGLTLSYSISGTATAGSGNDFTIRGSLTVAAGATSATIPVAINDDNTQEPSETVVLTLTTGTGYTLGSTRVHTLTITDNDDPPPPPPSPTTDPDQTPTTPVSDDPPPPSPTTDPDQTPTTPVSDEPPPLPLLPPSTGSDETPTTTTTARSGETTTPQPTPAITVQGGDAITEGGDAVFTVSASSAPVSALTVKLTVADDANGDFLAQSDEGEKTVTIAGGETSAPLTLATQDDSQDEADGSVTATVIADAGYMLGSASTATVAVSDNDETPPPVVTQGVQADPGAWLARFGRVVAGQALDGLAGRLAAARNAGFAGGRSGSARKPPDRKPVPDLIREPGQTEQARRRGAPVPSTAAARSMRRACPPDRCPGRVRRFPISTGCSAPGGPPDRHGY